MMSERMYHIDMAMGDAGRYVLLPGDPGRCEKIAAAFDHPREVAFHREYHSYTGMLDGVKVSVVSTGIGGPSTAICIEELHMLGADTFIRVGTCGGMQFNICPGDVVIATGAIRAEGTSREYLPIEFPAVADFQVLCALEQSAQSQKIKFHTGIVQCKDSFYGQHDPNRMPISAQLKANWQAWIAGGCLASEMESAALFIVGSVLHARTGSVHSVAGNQERCAAGMNDVNEVQSDLAIRTAIGALRLLIAKDRQVL